MTERVFRGEAERRSVDYEVVDLDNGPVEFALSSHRLKIVRPERDLGDDRTFTTDCVVIDESNYKPMIGEGYKALRDGEEVVLGRGHMHDRFRFAGDVSRDHALLSRSGTQVAIRDLGSQNGTFLLDSRPERIEVSGMAGFSVGKREQRNEDAYFVSADSGSFGVFDGVGSKAGSGHASQIAARTIERHLEDMRMGMSRAMGQLAVESALLAAHEAIIAENHADNHIETTAVVAKMFETPEGAPYIVVGHTGDSRAYRMRRGMLDHMTLDHAYRMPEWTDGDAMLIQEILSDVTDRSNLSERAALAFKLRNTITSALGNPQHPPLVTVKDYDVRPGDTWLLTSDGVHDNLTTEEMEHIVNQQDIEMVARALVHAARDRSLDKGHVRSKRDDITAVVASFDKAAR